jgi:hypothetical protein
VSDSNFWSDKLMNSPEEAEADNRQAPESIPHRASTSSNPYRPRTISFGYDRPSETLEVTFREGAVYRYYGVTPNQARNFGRAKSKGKWINRNLAGVAYGRVE